MTQEVLVRVSVICDEITDSLYGKSTVKYLSSADCSSCNVYNIVNIILDHYKRSRLFEIFYKVEEESIWFFHVFNLAYENENTSVEFGTRLKFYLQEMLLSGNAMGDSNILLLFNNEV